MAVYSPPKKVSSEIPPGVPPSSIDIPGPSVHQSPPDMRHLEDYLHPLENLQHAQSLVGHSQSLFYFLTFFELSQVMLLRVHRASKNFCIGLRIFKHTLLIKVRAELEKQLA